LVVPIGRGPLPKLGEQTSPQQPGPPSAGDFARPPDRDGLAADGTGDPNYPRITRNQRDPGTPRDPGSASGGVLGGPPPPGQTFRGSDPDTVAAAAICEVTPTRCQRAAEWTDSLRDLVNSILETNLTIQGNRMNVITKKVTSWAAIIAVPTFITGFYGMNVPYPGFSRTAGLAASITIMAIAELVLYIIFKRKDWL
jgi:CorA-like Mg2+ transporter protein